MEVALIIECPHRLWQKTAMKPFSAEIQPVQETHMWCPDLVFPFLRINISLTFSIKLLLPSSCLEIHLCACTLCWLLGEYGGTFVLEMLGASLPNTLTYATDPSKITNLSTFMLKAKTHDNTYN